MAKDPAFLFYSKDFYEGTRMMLPEERACYIDLLIYQHQNGTIPNDLKRVLMYCNGVDEATLIATLEAKFEKVEGGWENKILNKRISERENYKNKQSESGKLGQFWKKAKAFLSEKDFKSLQKLNYNKHLILDFIDRNEINKDTLKGLLKHCLSNNVNVNENVIEDIDKELKGGMGEKENLFIPNEFKPIWNEWLEYRKAKKKKPYAGLKWEQIAVNKFIDLSANNIENAKLIIRQTIENNWEGLFKLKNINQNGESKSNAEIFTTAMQSETAKNFRFK